MLTLRTRPNRTFLGLPGFRLWTWIYNLGDRGCCLSDGVAEAFKASGEPPAYLDPQLVQTDAEQLELYFRQEGFRQATVEPVVDTLGAGAEVRVTFRIEQGPPTFVTVLRYEGLEAVPEPLRVDLFRNSTLELPDYDSEDEPRPIPVFHPVGLRFAESQFRDERRHILEVLRNGGYPQINRDSIRAFVRPVALDSFDVTLRIGTGRRLRFGDVQFTVTGPETAPVRVDTLQDDIVVRIEDERQLRPRALTRALQFRPDDWFDQSRLVSTKQRLEGTGLFTFSDFVPQWSQVDSTGAGPLPYRIELRTRARHQLRGEFVMLSRDPVLGDESGSEEIGLGLGMSYRNGNLLGTGEVFQVRTSGSIAAAIRGRNPFNTAQAEIETSLTVPYLFRPFRRLDQALGLFDARSRIGLRFLSARREELRLIIRGRAAFQTGLEMRHTPTLSSIVNLIDFNLSDPDTLSGFSGTFLAFVDDAVERERILEDYSRPQVNNAFRYTLRSSTTNLFRRDQGYIREASVEVGGNVPYLLDRLVFTPDQVEGSLPGVPLFRGGGGAESRLVYRQYVRFLVDLRRYKPVSPRTVLAWKIIGGWAQPVGQATVVPFDRRFYSGGPSSVRGWRFRTLGPGAVTRRTSETLRGGEIKLEASAETRTVVLRNVLTANWVLALFGDVGNIWYGPRNPGDPAGRFRFDSAVQQLAVGSGFGLRIAWEYLIVRFDFGYKLHDPVEGFFTTGILRPEIHFGIGQAF